MKTAGLASKTLSLIALALLPACGSGGSSPDGTVIDRVTIFGRGAPVVVTLAAKRARTEFELPASTSQQSVAMQIEEKVPGRGEILPAKGFVLHVTTPGLDFDPPAIMRQAVTPPAPDQHYFAISMPSAGGTWVVKSAARRGTFHDALQSAETTRGTEVWEIDVTGSGLWALGLGPDSRLDGGLVDADDGGVAPEGDDARVEDGGTPSEPDSATFRREGDARTEVNTDVAASSTVEDAGRDALESLPDLGQLMDSPNPSTEADARILLGDAAPVVAIDASGLLDASNAAEAGSPPRTDAVTEGLLTASPAWVSFGAVVTGTTSPAASISIHNGGSAQTGTLSLVFGGTSAESFSLTSTCVGGLAAGATCVAMVTFKPEAAGDATGTLTITDRSVTTTVALSGQGAVASASQLTVSSQSLDFGAVAVGAIAAAASINIRNSGSTSTGPLALSLSGASANAFAFTTGCASPLAPGQTCTATVSFRPTAAGNATAILTTKDAKASATVSLTGVGLAAP